jgi:hypothetical protein
MPQVSNEILSLGKIPMRKIDIFIEIYGTNCCA